MKTFSYKPRSLRDHIVREHQTREETDRAPKVAPEELCTRPGCQHPRWSHCSIRRSPETREVLFLAKSRGEMFWQRVGGYSRFQSGYSAVRCRHSSPDGIVDFPCCNTSACAVRDCPCVSFRNCSRNKSILNSIRKNKKPDGIRDIRLTFSYALGYFRNRKTEFFNETLKCLSTINRV